jgi:hypothetical protein
LASARVVLASPIASSNRFKADMEAAMNQPEFIAITIIIITFIIFVITVEQP